jgi:F-type H+-transporting ATPase subunit b
MALAQRLARILLALLMITGAGMAFARAQQAPSPKPTQSNDDSAHRPMGPAQELVHESNETTEFKQSPSVQLVSRLTGLNLRQSYWLSVVLNFVVIAVIILWAGRKFLPGMFRARTAAIQKAMQEAQKASEEARRKLADIEARLAKLDVEIGRMREAAEKEGAAEVVRIQAGAQEDARKIVAAAEQEIAAAVKAARRQLTAYAGDLAVSLAQKQIRIDATTDHALVRNFAGQLISTSENQGKGRN